MKTTNTLLTLLLSTSLCSANALAQGEVVDVVFGVTSDDHPSEIRKRYRAFHRILEEEINKRLTDRQIHVVLAITPSYEMGIDQIVNGDAGFARLTPVAYVTVMESNPGVELLAHEVVVDDDDHPSNFGLIAVHNDSPIQSLEDLKGKSIAFADTHGAAGRYHAQEYLEANGIAATDFSQFDYLGRFDKVAEALEASEFDAGALSEGVYNHEVVHGDMPLRMVGEMFEVPFNAWVASPDLPEDIKVALAASLLEMDDPAMLEAGHVKGFVEASDGEYDSTRHAMANHGSDYPPKE